MRKGLLYFTKYPANIIKKLKDYYYRTPSPAWLPPIVTIDRIITENGYTGIIVWVEENKVSDIASVIGRPNKILNYPIPSHYRIIKTEHVGQMRISDGWIIYEHEGEEDFLYSKSNQTT